MSVSRLPMIRHFLAGFRGAGPDAVAAVDILRGRVLSRRRRGICVTGNGLNRPDVLREVLSSDVTIPPSLSALDRALGDLKSRTGW